MIRYTFVIAILFSSTHCLSDSFSSARFHSGEKSLQNRIRFPEKDVEDGIVIIKCAGRLSSKGKFNSLFCQTRNKREARNEFRRAIRSALRGSKLLPAYVNGKPEEVWFQFTVEFVKQGESEAIRVYPNHLYNYKKYGRDYIAPQRYSLGSRWPYRCRSKTLIWISTSISAAGEPSDPKVATGKAPKGCGDHMINFIRDGLYIPARHKGQYVGATYIEAFWTRDMAW